MVDALSSIHFTVGQDCIKGPQPPSVTMLRGEHGGWPWAGMNT